jgi:hypothetical protein
MANQKDTPNLPASSRMQMPSTSGNGTNGLIKETGGMMNGNSNGATRKVTKAASGKGMAGKNPYC